MRDHVLFKIFAAIAILEALSWAGLLTGMYFKYFTDLGDLGVRVFGPVHGGIFVLYLLSTLALARAFRWPTWLTGIGLVCAIPPFTTLAFELWVIRSQRVLPRAAPRTKVADAQTGAASEVRS